MASETIVLIDGGDHETRLIRGLIASFDMDLTPVDGSALRRTPSVFQDNTVCLVVLQADREHGRHLRLLGQIRRQLEKMVPLLVLLPEAAAGQSPAYVKAGADDVCLLPLNEGRFSIRFLVLLECGQAMVHTVVPPPTEDFRRKEGDLWHRIVGFLREGISFFTPGSQISFTKAQPIFNRWETPGEFRGRRGRGGVEGEGDRDRPHCPLPRFPTTGA